MASRGYTATPLVSSVFAGMHFNCCIVYMQSVDIDCRCFAAGVRIPTQGLAKQPIKKLSSCVEKGARVDITLCSSVQHSLVVTDGFFDSGPQAHACTAASNDAGWLQDSQAGLVSDYEGQAKLLSNARSICPNVSRPQ